MKAFPNTTVKATEPPGTHQKILDPGMDLRDYFAAKAIQGMLSNPSLVDTMGESTEIWIRDNAYKIADAMMEARSK